MKYNRENTIKEYMACGGILDVLKAVQAGEGYISEEAIEEAKELCTDIAEEGIVLLKNACLLFAMCILVVSTT